MLSQDGGTLIQDIYVHWVELEMRQPSLLRSMMYSECKCYLFALTLITSQVKQIFSGFKGMYWCSNKSGMKSFCNIKI